MKKPHVLNRAMFNRGGVSAYGRGITSNLVTEEQRQRFNYGGRVGLNWGSSYMDIDPSGKLYEPAPSMIDFWRGTGVYGNWDAIEKAEEDKRVAEAIQKDVSETEIGGSAQDKFWRDELNKARFGESDKYTTGPDGIGLIEKKIEATKTNGDDRTTEVMTDSDWMDLLGPTEEQKKRTKGEAQLGLAAGALDVFSQPSIAKGMKAASPHLLNLGKTATADQKAREKAILQGKVLSKVYGERAAAKGEADIKTAQYKIDALKGTGKPIEKFYARMQASEEKKPKDIINAIFEATDYKIKPEIMPADEKKSKTLLADPKNEGRIFIQGRQAFQIVKGNFVPIEYEEILKVTEDI